MTFSSKITLTDKEKSGTTEFELDLPALFHIYFMVKKKTKKKKLTFSSIFQKALKL